MAALRQTSFASGELSPYLWGRTDMELHAHGARKLLNFVINRQGAAVSRPGTLLAWDAKEAAVILLPFLHASGESYVLELGHLYVRIYNARTLALVTELVTPFQAGDLPELQSAQVGSTMVLAHYLRPAQELTLGAAASIVAVRFGPLGEVAGGASLEAVFPSIDANPPALPVLIQWVVDTLFVVDAAHPPREWKYKVSTLVRNNVTGQVIETLARDITQYSDGDVQTATTGAISDLPADNMLILYPDAPIYIEPGLGAAAGLSANWTAIENLYFRGRGQLFGLVGRAAPAARFADFGEEPDYLTPPLRGQSPFKAGEYPAAVGFFQQRRSFAGPASSWWASAVDQFENYDAPILNWPGQPLAATLLNRKRERLVAMASLEHLLVFTDTSVWCVGRNDVPLDFDTFPSVVRVVDEVGAHPLQPLVVDGVALFSRTQGRGVRGLQLSNTGSYDGADLSWHAEHLFRGGRSSPTATWISSRIISWCFQREPWGTVWAVRSDGALLTCTRTGSGTWAWARHDTGGDKALSVTCVPRAELAGGLGGWEDVFVVVERGGATRIERMTPGDIRGQPLKPTHPDYIGNPIGAEQLSYPVDSGVVATIIGGVQDTVVNGLAHLEGREVWASCPGVDPRGPMTVVDGKVIVTAGWGPEGGLPFKAAVGLPYNCDLETLNASPGSTNQKQVETVAFEIDQGVGISVGESFDKLTEWRQRTVADSYSYPSAASTEAKVLIKGSWNTHGRAVLRQSKPLPVTVLGITRELVSGGK